MGGVRLAAGGGWLLADACGRLVLNGSFLWTLLDRVPSTADQLPLPAASVRARLAQACALIGRAGEPKAREGEGRNARNLEQRNLVQRRLATSKLLITPWTSKMLSTPWTSKLHIKYHYKIWYKIPRLWHKNKQ